MSSEDKEYNMGKIHLLNIILQTVQLSLPEEGMEEKKYIKIIHEKQVWVQSKLFSLKLKINFF